MLSQKYRELRAAVLGTLRAWYGGMRAFLMSGVALILAAVGCSGSSNAPSDTPSSAGDAGSGNAGAAGGAVGGEKLAKADFPQTAASSIPLGALNAATTANNAMAVDLYGRARVDAETHNLLTSPISASLALTMTYAGAAGDTATEMAAALHIDPSQASSIFDGQNALSQALVSRGSAALARAQKDATDANQPAPSSDDYDLHVVNSVWGDQSYTWEMPFLATLAKSYGTGVYQVDFVHAFEPARLAINAWVSTETKNKIADLLPQKSLDQFTRMVLVNALHLRFPWATPFLPSNTASTAFTLGDGSTEMVDFMNQTENLAYVDDGRAQIASIPLANGELTLIVALPHEGVALADYEGTLTSGAPALTTPAASALVALSLPKTTFTSKTFSIKQAFQSMGMKSAFEANADFSGMCARPPNGEHLYVSDILQKTTIAMQEVGVEAAAATAVILSAGSAYDPNPPAPPTPVPMVVNRPYLLALVDQPTGAVLMLGHIADPTDAGSP